MSRAGHHGQYQKWTPERIRALDALRAEGRTLDECARALDTTVNSVRGFLYKRRHPDRPRHAASDKRQKIKRRLAKLGLPPVILPFTEPRPSMYALAEFDPVIRRALDERLSAKTPTNDGA